MSLSGLESDERLLRDYERSETSKDSKVIWRDVFFFLISYWIPPEQSNKTY